MSACPAVMVWRHQTDVRHAENALGKREGLVHLSVGDAKCGSRFDSMLVMFNPQTEREREFVEEYMPTALRPGGRVIYCV